MRGGRVARRAGLSVLIATVVLGVAWWWLRGSGAGSEALERSPSRSSPSPAPTGAPIMGSDGNGASPDLEGPIPDGATEPSPGEGRLLVTVVDSLGAPEPAGWASSVSCSLRPGVDPQSDGLVYLAPTGVCVLRGARQDGQVVAYGEPVEVVVVDGEDRHVRLVVPAERTGAMQVAFARSDEGLEVLWVPEGGLDGLFVGDIVVGIDGVPVTDLSVEEALSALRGPEGTTVAVEVLDAQDTGVHLLQLERRFIEAR